MSQSVRTAAAPSRLGLVGSYVALTKPRIIELLLVTTVPTMIVAERGLPPLGLVVATVAGGTLAAGGANAANMVVDADIDRRMRRTRNRPVAAGTIAPRSAVVFSIALEVVAFALLAVTVNLPAALLALAACLFYVFVYTVWLKRTSTQNIVIGGAAGAVPVLVGWAAVTGSLGPEPLVLFGVIFLWTPPHFWALAIRYRDDYVAAGVPMLPAVASLERTAASVLRYTLATVALTLVFGVVAALGPVYWVGATLAGAVFVYRALALRRRPEPEVAIRLFGWSITYLSVLFGAMAVDQLVGSGL